MHAHTHHPRATAHASCRLDAYELFAVVSHSGRSGSGHYTTLVRLPTLCGGLSGEPGASSDAEGASGSEGGGRWLELNDEKARV